MKRYETEGRRRVRSREVRILVVESFVLKKKREYEREEEEEATVRIIDGRASSLGALHGVSVISALATVDCRASMRLTPFSVPRAPSKLTLLLESGYKDCFLRV
jgi:hypothetical protein